MCASPKSSEQHLTFIVEFDPFHSASILKLCDLLKKTPSQFIASCLRIYEPKVTEAEDYPKPEVAKADNYSNKVKAMLDRLARWYPRAKLSK